MAVYHTIRAPLPSPSPGALPSASVHPLRLRAKAAVTVPIDNRKEIAHMLNNFRCGATDDRSCSGSSGNDQLDALLGQALQGRKTTALKQDAVQRKPAVTLKEISKADLMLCRLNMMEQQSAALSLPNPATLTAAASHSAPDDDDKSSTTGSSASSTRRRKGEKNDVLEHAFAALTVQMRSLEAETPATPPADVLADEDSPFAVNRRAMLAALQHPLKVAAPKPEKAFLHQRSVSQDESLQGKESRVQRPIVSGHGHSKSLDKLPDGPCGLDIVDDEDGTAVLLAKIAADLPQLLEAPPHSPDPIWPVLNTPVLSEWAQCTGTSRLAARAPPSPLPSLEQVAPPARPLRAAATRRPGQPSEQTNSACVENGTVILRSRGPSPTLLKACVKAEDVTVTPIEKTFFVGNIWESLELEQQQEPTPLEDGRLPALGDPLRVAFSHGNSISDESSTSSDSDTGSSTSASHAAIGKFEWELAQDDPSLQSISDAKWLREIQFNNVSSHALVSSRYGLNLNPELPPQPETLEDLLATYVLPEDRIVKTRAGPLQNRSRQSMAALYRAAANTTSATCAP